MIGGAIAIGDDRGVRGDTGGSGGFSASAKRELFECLPCESLFGNILRAPSQALTKKIAEHLLLLELNKSHFSGCRVVIVW
ncbi:hypothetical protein MKW98_028269 [Papaver atlanticum]|uniref:Uncharacterized protein n=1 Tax=Papaver atlanticum TaxID=357466 RepID=A0AAD4SY03_9MAGN|nr:hypothetical protein MKW98_028269 [Papaver atlanticum]